MRQVNQALLTLVSLRLLHNYGIAILCRFDPHLTMYLGELDSRLSSIRSPTLTSSLSIIITNIYTVYLFQTEDEKDQGNFQP